MTEPNPHALTGAYALDALDGAELDEFRAHLAACDSCPSEAAELRATATRLVDLVERTPPPELRERVLRAVDRTPQQPPLPVSLAEHRDRRRGRAALAAGGLLAAAAVAAGALVVVTANDAPTAEEIVAAADATTVDVDGGAATAQITVSPSLDAAVLQVTDMSPPPDGKTYQAWVLAGDEVIPSDTFEPTESGALTEVLTGAEAATGFAVTVEPDGGSPTGQPTDLPVMVFDLTPA